MTEGWSIEKQDDLKWWGPATFELYVAATKPLVGSANV